MPNEIKWNGSTSRTTGISAASINAGANSLGDEIDNSTNKDRFISLVLEFTCAVAATEGKAIELYLVRAIDGTNYEDGDGSTDPLRGFEAVFFARAVTSAQRQSVVNIPIGPFKFKCLLKSELDQNATSVTLKAYTHNEEVQ